MGTRVRTETSAFGVSKRESHDSSAFYERQLGYVQIDPDSTVNKCVANDSLYCASSESMAQVNDNSVALMVTSPGYHVGKDSDHDDMPFEQYLSMLERVFTETYRVLEPGGRAAINVANLGRKPYVHFNQLIAQMCLDIGFFSRGEIIWQKGEGASGNCAWGTFAKAGNPVLRDLHEYVMVFSKGRFDRAISVKDRAEAGLPHTSTITKDEFMEATLSIWKIPPASAKRIGHPAPFPVELPLRLIHLYTYLGDTVLDPFIGSGTTAVAAAISGRHYVGYDIDPSYLALAGDRIADALIRKGLPE